MAAATAASSANDVKRVLGAVPFCHMPRPSGAPLLASLFPLDDSVDIGVDCTTSPVVVPMQKKKKPFRLRTPDAISVDDPWLQSVGVFGELRGRRAGGGGAAVYLLVCCGSLLAALLLLLVALVVLDVLPLPSHSNTRGEGGGLGHPPACTTESHCSGHGNCVLNPDNSFRECVCRYGGPWFGLRCEQRMPDAVVLVGTAVTNGSGTYKIDYTHVCNRRPTYRQRGGGGFVLYQYAASPHWNLGYPQRAEDCASGFTSGLLYTDSELCPGSPDSVGCAGAWSEGASWQSCGLTMGHWCPMGDCVRVVAAWGSGCLNHTAATCGAHGTCIPHGHNYSCGCAFGYNGTRCETKRPHRNLCGWHRG